jgi:hypothetical protein
MGIAIAIALLVAAGFMVVLQASISGAFRAKRPQLALTWMPYDAQARARLAGQLVANQDAPEALEAAIKLATDAVRRDPIVPVAFRALAIAQDGDGRIAKQQAFALIEQSQRLSRRDQLTQIWLIQHYIEQGEITQVMPHVDIALRASSSGQQTLFPLLVSAFEDDRLFDALQTRLHEDPEWRYSFLAYLVTYSNDLERTTRLSQPLLNPQDPTDRKVVDALLQRLVNGGEFDLAWDAYTGFGLTKGTATPAGSLIDGGFDGQKVAAPFGWQLTDTPDVFASIVRDPEGEGTVLTLSAKPGHSGDAARQLLRLSSGTYRFHAKVGSVPQDPFERPEVRMECAGPQQRILARVKPTRGGATSQTVEHQFSVPAGCRFQWLSVSIAGSEAISAEAPWIDDIRLLHVAG